MRSTEPSGSSSQGTSAGGNSLLSQQNEHRLSFISPSSDVDPFRHESLRRATVDIAVRNEAIKTLGTLNNMEEISAAYFKSTHTRLPIISTRRFYERLPTLFSTAPADFMTLCLCIHLVQETPPTNIGSMLSSLYVTVKGIISLLEATNYSSLDVVQSRLIVTFYEMGHGIYPTASISIGACARLARSLKSNVARFEIEPSDIEVEERNRVRWAVFNLDRFISLCNADTVFGIEDPASSDALPIEDAVWAQNVIPPTSPATPVLATPSDITVGQFARECQVSHLAGRVIRHVFDPTSDGEFQTKESLQLERTLLAFRPVLVEEELHYGKYCAALGICIW
ncbi:hypothetical protein NA57DRAFT_79012 [Rhizodiscina lignyota]|uniref:Xylanolytic transcriptional activator regulatory domain-containing protein n=1 Tax=Rhizodiscina lignyota TaxID=1504668 RepID=A0A9P4I761_9PEZI|nr:hypothetical protein NA57DRAFT_79012 [Rhizodiscina lignyota]